MAIRDKNIDHDNDNNTFAQQSLVFSINVGASVSGVIQGGWKAPWDGKIVSAHVYCATITDADDSIRVDIRKDTVSLLDATVDPVAADTATTLTVNDDDFDADDVLQVYMTTAGSDAFIGTVTLIVRPRLGRELMPGYTTL
jgi:hypothetical protein